MRCGTKHFKMRYKRAVTMRCASRYIITAFVILLVIASIKLSLFSDKTINLFRSRANMQNLFGYNGIIGGGRFSKGNTTTLLKHRPFQSGSVKSIKKSIITSIKGRNSSIARTWEEYKRNPNFITGNSLIDDYGKNDVTKTGENGRGVTFSGGEKKKSEELLQKYNLNVYASDVIPLNRKVPDSRFKGYVYLVFVSFKFTFEFVEWREKLWYCYMLLGSLYPKNIWKNALV